MISPRNYRYPCQFAMNCSGPYIFRNILNSRFHVKDEVFDKGVGSRFRVKDGENWSVANAVSRSNLEGFRILVKCGFVLAAMVCGVLVFGCRRVLAVEEVVNARYGVFGQSILLLRNAWPKVSQVLRVFKEQGLILVALLSLSAFFSMAETSITTLWPWKVRYAAHTPTCLVRCRMHFSGRDEKLKTGIVGRTGSGKLTLIQTIF